MKGPALRTVGKAATDRAIGLRPGMFRALMAATVTGSVTAALTYRLLRSGGED
jgi:hypothetical protein